jgi:hypothetical protein
MSDAFSLAAGLLRQVASGRPIDTDRERVEYHVRRALRCPATRVVWEDSMMTATRRILELSLRANHPPLGWSRCESILDHEWHPFADSALDALAAIDQVVLDQGRAANRAANVTPKRRLAAPLDWVETPTPAVVALSALVSEAAGSLVSSHEPRGWKIFAAAHEPLDHRTRELAHAAAAGLMTGYRVDGRGRTARRTLVLVPRPVVRVRHAPGIGWPVSRLMLHAEQRPAVEWPDGTRVWFWDGIEIPNRIAEHLDALTPDRILAIRNQEVRRRVIDRVGWERFLADARRVAQDDFGTLWDTGLRLDGERLRVVEVVNATREPDGTHRHYVLRVPPATRTARQAVAWTFGFESADDYVVAAAS